MQVSFAFPAFVSAQGLAGGPLSGLETPADVRRVLSEALDDVSRRAAHGDEASAAARRVVSWDGQDLADFVAQVMANVERLETTALRPLPGSAAVLYDCAAAAAAGHRLGQAGIGLAALLGPQPVRIFGLVGLAVCAARLGCFDEALTLAVESFGAAVGHPRAYCIAGFCEIKRGNRRAAQTYLSGASRLARRDPAHAEDLRMAQRMLLLMHLADERHLDSVVDVEPS